MNTREWQIASELPDQEVGTTDEWLLLFASRDEVAEAYALMLLTHSSGWTYWREINDAILRRWSPYALRYIKTKAWRLAEAANSQEPPDA